MGTGIVFVTLEPETGRQLLQMPKIQDSMDNKVIISCAITGSIHTPTMSPYLPFTPEDIARQAIEAAEAGAAILHFHARDPETGEPTARPGRLPAIPARDQSGDQRGHQHHHRRRPDHEPGSAARAGAAHQAGTGLVQHGLHQFLHPSHRRAATANGNTTGKNHTWQADRGKYLSATRLWT